MKLIAALAIAILSACGVESSGPATSIDVRIKNAYAESIFNVDYAYTESATGVVNGSAFVNKRIAGNSAATAEGAIRPPDYVTDVTITFSGTSLGELHEFEPLALSIVGHEQDVLEFVYDYDIAAGSFRVTHAWKNF